MGIVSSTTSYTAFLSSQQIKLIPLIPLPAGYKSLDGQVSLHSLVKLACILLLLELVLRLLPPTKAKSFISLMQNSDD